MTITHYQWLSEYYDEIFGSFHVPLDRARERLLGNVLPRVKVACDLACGTGTTALMLARRGIRMYGVDESRGMCRAARAKSRAAGVPLRVIRAEMQSFRLPEPVDLITSEGDAVNHVPRPADLGKVARAAARALRPGGHFYFDVNNSKGFARYWTGNMWIEKPGLILVMRNGHNKAADRAWSDVEIFVREGACWRRRSERVEEVCWTSEEIRATLRQAGFDQVRGWDAAPFFAPGNPDEEEEPLIGPGCRTFYVARKRR